MAEENSSSIRNQAKSVCIEIPEQKSSSSSKKCNNVPFMKRFDESRSPSSDVHAKEVLEKKIPPLRKSNSTRTQEISMILQDSLCQKMHELTVQPIKPIEEKQKFLREQDELYLRCRKKAFEMTDIVRSFIEERKDAHARGDHICAKELSKKIKIARKAAFKFNRKAAQEILETTNKNNGIMKIDLHGLHQYEAIQAVKKRLNTIETKSKTLCSLSSIEKPLLLEVITGVGKHSRGVPKLPPAVRSFLVDEGYQFKEDRPGVIMVRPKFRAT